MKFFLKNLKNIFEDFSRIFQEYFPQSNHKSNAKVGGCGSCYPVCTHQILIYKTI
jgi:hypothetical protein